ncbi:MAG TPA: FecR family protein [Steroidobacteraceae bacterium]|nr:FecR family protein [Steroidobacteraceae bacterium]
MFQFGVLRRILTTALVLAAASSACTAEEGAWSVGKSSGEVWITTTGAEQVSLKQEEALKPGDIIRTGRNGRVLLVRGEETILISPNSVIGLPTEKKDGLSTTIVQQAGSILLEVEKRNVKHFEVETPYLAAVVKGTQFSVTVNAASTSVEVRRGQVEVSDFKSGQIAQVMPGQVATAFTNGKPGLSLSGSGTFNPIGQGKPRASSIERVPVPKTGLSAPGNAANGKLIHALGQIGAVKMGAATLKPPQASGDTPGRPKGARIAAALGEVRLNFQKVTHGLAHGAIAPGSAKTAKDTVWSDAKASMSGANGLSQGNSNTSGSGNTANGGGATTTSPGASTVAAVTAPASQSGDGNGKGNNGNGNGGVGNGNGKGNAKH